MATIKTHGGKDLYQIGLKPGKDGELEVTSGPHLAGLDCPLCNKRSELFFNLAGGMGKDSKGVWTYFGCKHCDLVVYDPDHPLADFSPTPQQYSKIINPLVEKWNKMAMLCLARAR